MLFSSSRGFLSGYMGAASVSAPKAKFYYKILTPKQAEEFRQDRIYHGNQKDLTDGFIHLCNTIEQCNRVRERSYKDKSVHILTLQFKRHVNIISERASDGDRYPHLYGLLRSDDVIMEQAI